MLKQLSGTDAGFLYMETGSSFGHVNSLAVYTRPADPDFDPYRAFRDQIEARLPILEPYRRRLVEVPFELDHPYWLNDPDFDLDFHLRHIAIPAPGDDEQLAELVARLIGRPLDRARPLWEAYVIEGLSSGEFAIMSKIHHATIDGAAGAEMMSMLLDHDQDATAEHVADDWVADRMPTDAEMLARGLLNLARRPGKAVRFQIRALRQLGQATRSEGITAMADLARRGMPGPLGAFMRRGMKPEERDPLPTLPTRTAPPTPFNRSITAHRRFAFRSASLADVKATKSLLGVTVNDVVMAVCAGALRRYLEAHEALPDEPLVAMVPVSIRTGDEDDRWTNRVSSLFPQIPTHLADPLDRVKAVHETMQEAKHDFDLMPADLIQEVAELAPRALATRASRLASRINLGDRVGMPVNLVVSNVPGPRTPLYFAGAQMTHYYPVSTIVEGQGLNITVQSYVDHLDFGLVACRELVPDLDYLAELCIDEIQVLKKAAGEVASP